MTDARDPFVSVLIDRLSADPRVIGLVLAGSSAEPHRRDQWSDHDFLVVTEDGTPEAFRTDLSWLPDHDELAFSFRDTPHGLKALYRTGLLVEFAVFDRAEFAGCVLNHYAIVIDRAGIAELADKVRTRSMAPRPVDRAVVFRNLLTLVYIATNRARRGERLSANVFLRSYATEQLLRLARDLQPDGDPPVLDSLDPWRRVEQADPALAADIDAALAMPVEEAARVLLDVTDRHLAGRWSGYPSGETDVIRGLLGW